MLSTAQQSTAPRKQEAALRSAMLSGWFSFLQSLNMILDYASTRTASAGGNAQAKSEIAPVALHPQSRCDDNKNLIPMDGWSSQIFTGIYAGQS